MTKEHLGLALALNVPVFVVVTKIDMCPPNVLQETMKLLSRILKSPGCRKIPVIVQGQDDVITSATNFSSARSVMHTCTYTLVLQMSRIHPSGQPCVYTMYVHTQGFIQRGEGEDIPP